ncbi:hypothetical protein DFH06DRAFT_72908 [Mycena polygramma]|nr:hypothetical protein DFH06DRAFT_72908 [Mycena polygramma]
MAGNDDAQPLRRVEDLWFPRDTVVIRAEDTIFQVSRAVLGAKSSVFSDMIAFPQPTTKDTQVIDGSPVVRLHDSSADVEVFLRAIFDSTYFLPAPAEIELPITLGILRLSHKYDVQYLHRRALGHLAASGWYAETVFNHPFPWAVNPPGAPVMRSLSVISAATEVGALWLLPKSYYFASGYPTELLLPYINGPMREYVQKCLVARPHLVRGTIAVNRVLIPTCNGCPAGCSDIAQAVFQDLLNSLELDDESGFKPLETLVGFENDARVCASCMRVARRNRKKALNAFWAKVPSIFGLPPWPELHAMKKAALDESASGNAAN